MAERNVPTITSINYKGDGTVDIMLNYAGKPISCSELMPHITSVDISDNAGSINGVNINEGDLYAFIQCYPEWVQMSLDNNGLLSITVHNDNETGYTIDQDTGELLFTYN